MSQFSLSSHAREMLIERNISEDWLWQTINDPDQVITGKDANQHYIKSISDRDGRFLHVVINPKKEPFIIVTIFFDRRLGRQK